MQPLDIETFKPRLKTLGKEQAWAIHSAALEILAKTGFKMEHPKVLEMLQGAGCTVENENWVTMPAYVAEEAIKSAPKQYALYDQQGNKTMPLTNDNFFYGTGSDTIFTHDLETRKRRRTVIKDTGNFARIVDALPNMDFSMSMGNPTDVPIENIYVHAFAEMIRNSNKPISFIADSGKDMKKIYDMACLVAGGEDEFQKKPFILNYSEVISPLKFPENVMEKLVFCAEKKIPICLPSGCNAGGGGPITLAGAMALGIAENLAGLVIHQLAGKGSPFLFAPNVSVLDMKHTVVSYGCTEWSLTQAALADMRDEIYQIPIWSFAGATDSKVIDAQAGAEGMLSIITSMLSRCNIIHDVGYIEFGNASSLEMLVMADELVGMSRFFTEGIPVNKETLALDIIERVAKGPEGSMFLSDPHTFEHFKTAHFLPELMDRARYESWEKKGKKDLAMRCNEKARRLLKEHKVIPKSKEVETGIDKILHTK